MLTENERLTLAVAIGSAGISLVSVGISLAQLRSANRLARHQATFDHLGGVRQLLREVSVHDPVEAREAALAYWNHEVDEVAANAQAYLDLLDEWDLLGTAFREKSIDRKIVLKSLRYTFRNPHNVNREFIDQVKKTFENPGMYADLDYLIGCCLRPTWFEWITAQGRALNRKTANPASAAATEARTPDSGELPLERSEARNPSSTGSPPADPRSKR
jgi:hypothetical protein